MDPEFGPPGKQHFDTTLWGVVLRARDKDSPDASQALEQLCQTYWYPLYAYARRRGYAHHAAEDLIQDFFARLLSRNFLKNVGPEKGRFRTLLLTALERFMCDDHARRASVKRGGRITFVSRDAQAPEQRYALEPVDQMSADRLFERRWALTILESVLNAIEGDYQVNDQSELFEALKSHLLADDDLVTYADTALRLGLSEGAVKMQMYRLRRRFQLAFRRVVADTVADPLLIESEIAHLVSLFAEPQHAQSPTAPA